MPSDFPTAINREIVAITTRLGITESKAFLYWFATQILEIEEDAALEAISVDGANDKGIDLFHVDDDEGRVLIAQGKYSTSLNYTAKESDVSNLESCLNWLVSPESLEREGKPELAQAARDFLEAQKEGSGVELFYLYAGAKTANVEKKINVYNQNPDNIEKRRAFRHYHLGLIKEMWEETQGERLRIDRDIIATLEEPIKMTGRFGCATVLAVPAAELVRLYTKYEDRLFDRNVRLFLGARKGSVNAGIAETLGNDKEKPNFWAYNNGVTIICDSFKAGKNTVELRNFSIVNGCQTTVSLSEHKGSLDDVSVLVRCIAASSSILDSIIRFTNSQNPIRTWDIASQDNTQRRMKREFEGLKKPFVYLTRRGDRRPIGALKKFRENGKLRLIRIDIAGQFMAAFRKGDPVLAYKHKAFIFSRYHDDVFPPDIRCLEVLFCWVAGEVCRQTVHGMIKDSEDNARILKKGGTLFALAVMAQLLKERNGLNYLTTLKEEQVSSKRTADRLKSYAQYAARLYIAAVADEAEIQIGVELPTLVRQKEFFAKVLKRALRQYEKDALNKDWIDGVLPKLGK